MSYPVIGSPPDAVAVPTHFFKVVLAERRGSAFVTAGFILPNRPIGDKKELRDFQAPLDVIEKQAGLLFFDKVRRLVTDRERERLSTDLCASRVGIQLRHVTTRDLCTETKCSLAPAYWRAVEGQADASTKASAAKSS